MIFSAIAGMFASACVLLASEAVYPGVLVPPEATASQREAEVVAPAAELVPALPKFCAERGISRGWIATFDVGVAAPGGCRTFTVPTTRGPLTLSVFEHSVRGEGYRLVASPGRGVFVDAGEELPPVATVRGSVREIPDSVVAGSIFDDGRASLVIFLPDGERIAIEPIDGAGGAHLLYRTEDLLPTGALCGADHDDDGLANGNGHAQFMGGDGGVAGGTTAWAQVAVDADYPFFLEQGRSLSSVALRVDNAFNVMNVQYESQCNIEHRVSGIIVRTTAAADPYDDGAACTSGPDESGMVWDIQGEWRGSPPIDVTWDAVMLFTGRSYPRSDGTFTVGCAMTDSICNENVFRGAYSFVVANFLGTSNVTFAADDLAHEFGHMWNASHCTCTSPPSTMNPSITLALQFSSGSVVQVMSHLSAHPSCFERAAAPPVIGCGTGASCYQAHATPWCGDSDCCLRICAIDPFCCASGGSWDEICVQRAASSCGTCGAASGQACTQAHAGAGCWDVDCCGTVCAMDPFCCDTQWDFTCAAEASSNCGHGESCETAMPIATGGSAAVVTGPSLPDPNGCYGTWSANRPRWYVWTAAQSGAATFTVCTGDFEVAPITLSAYGECGTDLISCFGAESALACGIGNSRKLTFAVQAGRPYRVRVAGSDDSTIYSATISAAFYSSPKCGAAGAQGCLAAHPTQPGCSYAPCCSEICARDPYCCDVGWDSQCVTAARYWCGFNEADLNTDGRVDAADLAQLLGAWGMPGATDLNHDGTTNAADIGILLARWG
jgi:hypothetical protein